MKFILTTFLLTVLIQSNNVQKGTIELIPENPKYESIVDVIVGTPRWKLNPDSDFEAGFKYRIVVTRMEIYETLFVEKLMIDIEGGITNLAWSKKGNMSTLVKNLDIATEQQTFSNIKWINEQSFKAQIQNVPFIARISNDEKQLDID